MQKGVVIKNTADDNNNDDNHDNTQRRWRRSTVHWQGKSVTSSM